MSKDAFNNVKRLVPKKPTKPVDGSNLNVEQLNVKNDTRKTFENYSKESRVEEAKYEKTKSVEQESLAAKVMREEKEAREYLSNPKNHDGLMNKIESSNEKNDFSLNAKIMLNYMQKYLHKNKKLHEKMTELENSPDIKNEFCELEWALLVEQAWIMSYKKAMDDEYISLEERHELNMLYSMGVKHRNQLYARPQMRQMVLDKFKVFYAIDNKYAEENKFSDSEIYKKQYDSVPKQTKYYQRLPRIRPKLTPYDMNDGSYGYR